MSSNVKSFNAGLDDFADSVDAEVEELHQALTLEVLKGVLLMTPVDTGRARGSWQVTQLRPAQGNPERRLDKTGQTTIAAETPEALAAVPFTVSYVTSNLDYILELENGHSQQAPRGMAEVTVERLRNWAPSGG